MNQNGAAWCSSNFVRSARLIGSDAIQMAERPKIEPSVGCCRGRTHSLFQVILSDDLEFVGSGGITIIDPTNLSYSSMDRARRGDPVSLIDVKLHILISGGRFEIQSRTAFAE